MSKFGKETIAVPPELAKLGFVPDGVELDNPLNLPNGVRGLLADVAGPRALRNLGTGLVNEDLPEAIQSVKRFFRDGLEDLGSAVRPLSKQEKALVKEEVGDLWNSFSDNLEKTWRAFSENPAAPFQAVKLAVRENPAVFICLGLALFGVAVPLVMPTKAQAQGLKLHNKPEVFNKINLAMGDLADPEQPDAKHPIVEQERILYPGETILPIRPNLVITPEIAKPTAVNVNHQLISEAYPDFLPVDQEVAVNAGGRYLNPESANRSLALLVEMTGISISDMRVVEAQSGLGESFRNTAVAVAEMPDGREVLVLWVGPSGAVGENPDWAPVSVEEGAFPVLIGVPAGLDYAVFVEESEGRARYSPYLMDSDSGDPVALIAGYQVDVENQEAQPVMLLVEPETGRVYSDVLVTENVDGQLVMSDEAGYHVYDPERNWWEGVDFTNFEAVMAEEAEATLELISVPTELQERFGSLELEVETVDENGEYRFSGNEMIRYQDTNDGGKWIIFDQDGEILHEVQSDDLIRSTETGDFFFLGRESFDGKRVNVWQQTSEGLQSLNIEVGFPEDPASCNVLPEGVGMEPILLAERVFVENLNLEGSFESELWDEANPGKDTRILFNDGGIKLASCLERPDGSFLARFAVNQPESDNKVAFLNLRILMEANQTTPAEWLQLWKDAGIIFILVNMTEEYAIEQGRVSEWEVIQANPDLVEMAKQFLETGVISPALEVEELIVDGRIGWDQY